MNDRPAGMCNPRHRTSSQFACTTAIAALVFLCWPSAAHARTWLVLLEQVVGERTYTAAISCPEDAKEISRKTMTLSLDGREHAVSVVAWTWGSNIFLKFYDGETALWVDSQPYVLVPIWDAKTLPDRKIDLREPTPLDEEDSPNPLLHYPVERGATTDATIIAKFRAVDARQ